MLGLVHLQIGSQTYWSMCVDPIHRYVLVQHSFTARVSIFDSLDGELINDFELDAESGIRQPTDIAVDPRTCTILTTDYEKHTVKRYDYSGGCI